MPIEGKLGSLYTDKEQTQPLFPRTKTKAVTDDDNIRLDIILDSLKTTVNSKASEAFVMNAIANAQLGGGEGEIDLSGYATKDDIAVLATKEELNAIDYPVDSVNGKTGDVTLSAADVGAATSSHEHAASDITSGTLGLVRGGTGRDLSAIEPYSIIRAASNSAYLLSTPTANGAFYATGDNTAAKFGTLPIAQGGTGGKTADEALTNLGAVKKSGDTMTGALTTTVFTVDSDMPTIGFNETDAKKSYHIVQGNRHYLRSTASDTDFYEQFRTPTPSTGLTGNKSYDFLTTKNPVTIEQGGTEATTAAGARKNLGIGSNQVFNKLTDLGITTFPTTMATVASKMPTNSTLMLDSRDILANGTSEISDLGNTTGGMYMFMKGNSTARISLLNIYGSTSASTSLLKFGCYASTADTVTWKQAATTDYTVNTSVSGLTLVKSNGIVHAYSHSGYILRTGVIPSGYRPKNALNLFGQYIDSNYTNYDAIIKIETDGTIHENHASAWDTGNYWVRFQASWQV